MFYAYVSDLFIFRLSHILIKYGILGQPKVCGQRRALNKGKKKKTRSSRRAVGGGGGSRRREKESNLKTNPASIRQNSTRLKSRKRMEVSEIGFRLAAAASAPAAALVSQ